MSDVFISYASADRPKARLIAAIIEEQGWSVWWDRIIPAGRTFEQVIESELNAAKCVLVLWSKASVESSWVREEATEGRRRQILVPVLIDEVRIPLGFRSIQAADLTNWEGTPSDSRLGKLIADISILLGAPRQIEKTEPTASSPEFRLSARWQKILGIIIPERDSTRTSQVYVHPGIPSRIMRAGLAFWAGVIGAAVMVLGMWISRMAGGTAFSFSLWWGSMVTGSTSIGSWWIGFVIHLILGGLVGLVFGAFFEAIGRSNWLLGLLGGVVFTVIGGLVLEWISLVHPAFPQVIPNPGYFTATWGGGSIATFIIVSLIYGIIVGGMYEPTRRKVAPARGRLREEQPVGVAPERHEREEIYVPPEDKTPPERPGVRPGKGRRS
jgi:hypothetical protein